MKGLDGFATLVDLIHPDMADIIILRKVLVLLKLSDCILQSPMGFHGLLMESSWTPCGLW